MAHPNYIKMHIRTVPELLRDCAETMYQRVKIHWKMKIRADTDGGNDRLRLLVCSGLQWRGVY